MVTSNPHTTKDWKGPQKKTMSSLSTEGIILIAGVATAVIAYAGWVIASRIKRATKVYKIYLAGPEVFHPNVFEIAKHKKDLCEKYGFEGIFPMDAEIDGAGLAKPDIGREISKQNEKLMRECDFAIANLTPFRGPSADVGTAFEVGFLTSAGKTVFGYSNSAKLFHSRVVSFVAGSEVNEAEVSRDPEGMSIEDFDLSDNLMIPSAVERSGGKIILEDSQNKERYTALHGFEECLKAAAIAREKGRLSC